MVNNYLSAFEEKVLLDETKASEQTKILDDILIDADALVALAKVDDSNHKKAISISKNLQMRGVFWLFSPFTIAESTTVLSHKVSQRSAKDFLRAIRELDIPVLSLKEEDIPLVDTWFLKQEKKGTSYFDCYNMAILQKHKDLLLGIFSFDKIYSHNGFKTAEQL